VNELRSIADGAIDIDTALIVGAAIVVLVFVLGVSLGIRIGVGEP
jgi:hypothetical protein